MLQTTKHTYDMYFDNTFGSGNTMAIIAFYGDDGEMKGVGMVEVAIARGKVVIEIPANAPQYDYCKVYLWRDLANRNPLVKTE